MSKPIFIDTSYIIAFFHARDKYHERAQDAARRLAKAGIGAITTEAVLAEVGNALARTPTRSTAVRILDALRSSSDLEVLPVDTILFDAAVSLYRERIDKEWGLTDCISFVVMHKRGLTQVLTADHHFEQAGFRIVM